VTQGCAPKELGGKTYRCFFELALLVMGYPVGAPRAENRFKQERSLYDRRQAKARQVV